MRVSLEVDDLDDLSTAFEVNISLSSQDRRSSKKPQANGVSGGASVAKDGGDSVEDDEYGTSSYPD